MPHILHLLGVLFPFSFCPHLEGLALDVTDVPSSKMFMRVCPGISVGTGGASVNVFGGMTLERPDVDLYTSINFRKYGLDLGYDKRSFAEAAELSFSGADAGFSFYYPNPANILSGNYYPFGLEAEFGLGVGGATGASFSGGAGRCYIIPQQIDVMSFLEV